METKNALQRLGWRFSEALKTGDKSFRINTKDLEALKTIDLTIQEHQSQQYEQNELFAKLYIYIYQKILENDGHTVLDSEPRRKLYNLLKKPLANIISDFTQSLNESERYELIENVGVELDHPALKSEEKRLQDTKLIQEALKDPENMEKFLGEVWDFETVSEILQVEVNKAINLFK